MFTLHFKRYVVGVGVVIILMVGIFFWLKHKIAKIRNPSVVTIILPKDTKERVSFNEKTHILTVTTLKGTITEYARNPEVFIRNNGDVVINRHLLGLERDWFMGLGYADCPRIFLGVNLFHFSRFDIHASLGGASDSSRVLFKPYLGVGYNFWSNTSVNVSANPINFGVPYKPDIAVFLSVKF